MISIDKTKIVYFKTRENWRKWLEKNFDKKKEIWLVFPKKSTGRKRIEYNDAVEEALCFNWIDSTVKSLDDENSIQRFSPRNPKSSYSQPNKERLKWLLEKNMIHPSFIDRTSIVVNEEFIFPKDILNAIKKDNTAWKKYNSFSDSYKRIRIAYIEAGRKRPEEFQKRLSNFIRQTKQGKMIRGHGGIEKYY